VLRVSIDNGPFERYATTAGINNITANPLSAGAHTLVVAANYVNDEIKFSGLELDEGATTKTPAAKKKLIEYIGDSITSGSNTTGTSSDYSNVFAYPFLVSKLLGSDQIQISYPGITLCKDYRNDYPGAPTVGQEQRYFWLKQPNKDQTPWNFSNYTPDLVVINLGTNDRSIKLNIPPSVFEQAYKDFLRNIRDKLPTTKIIVLRTFRGYLKEETVNAVNARIAVGDTKVFYVDTEGWLDMNSQVDYFDKIHPTKAGHQKLAEKLAPILIAYLH
jgi:lysophospholipase L1-like esterase